MGHPSRKRATEEPAPLQPMEHGPARAVSAGLDRHALNKIIQLSASSESSWMGAGTLL